jgi:YD repeat-containing protein
MPLDVQPPGPDVARGRGMRRSHTFGRRLVVFLSLALAAPAWGSVNMWSGGLTQTWTDLETPTSSLHLRRTYHSRSIHEGIFGFGWCTELETGLRTLPDGSWRLRDCDRGEAIHFSPSPTAPPLVLRNGLLEYRLQDGSLKSFSRDGKLIRILKPGGELITLGYSKDGRIERAVSSKGESLKFTFETSSGKVARVDSSRGRHSAYAYENGNLTLAVNESGGRIHYSYDSLRNLGRVEYPDGSIEAITYDQAHDRVSSRSTRDRCMEHYSFAPSVEDPAKRFIAEARKTCRGRTLAISRHEYTHRTDDEGRVHLSRVRITRGDGTLETLVEGPAPRERRQR